MACPPDIEESCDECAPGPCAGCWVQIARAALSEPMNEHVHTDSQWIPVEERLPERKCFVLVSDDDGAIRSAMFVHGEFLGQIVLPVTHWMPLPPPPDSPQKGEWSIPQEGKNG